MRVIGIWIAAVICVAAGSTVAQDNGRYQLVAMPPGANTFSMTALILDTREGHLWEWFISPTTGQTKGSAGIVYLGQVITGASAGQMVQQWKFDQTPPPAPWLLHQADPPTKKR